MNTETNIREVFAAISYALHEELGKHMHDQESYQLTIKPRTTTAWSIKTQYMRTLPGR